MNKQNQWLFELSPATNWELQQANPYALGEQEWETTDVLRVPKSVARKLSRTVSSSTNSAVQPLMERTAYGWGQYRRRVEELPPDQQTVLVEVGTEIKNSFKQGRNPVHLVQVYGHADWDTPRNPQREKQISDERALITTNWLKNDVGSNIAAQIIWDVKGFGANKLKANPTTEANRRQNRRVEIFLFTKSGLDGLDQQVEDILNYIRSQAKKAAIRPRTLANTRFANVVKARYLSGYLAAPSFVTATTAINAISRQNTRWPPTIVCPHLGTDRGTDRWERAAPAFNNPIPAAVRNIPGFGWLPPNLGGSATEIITVANRRQLPHIDGPFLLGKNTLNLLNCKDVAKIDPNLDVDLQFHNSINESQLMHWATGVKYSHLRRDQLRELFLAYELWHLEFWDVFGHDPINDLIAEDAARHMAGQIRSLRMNSSNYIQTLDEGFKQARAWVGAMLRLRRNQLEHQIRADVPSPTRYHWRTEYPATSRNHPYQLPSIRQMLASGKSVDQVKASDLVKCYIQVYTLLFEADVWEQANGRVPLSLLQIQMISGRLNPLFQRLALLEGGRSISSAPQGKIRSFTQT
ncbi:MAG TPA: OmpA family protein [Stenomitos sp.]